MLGKRIDVLLLSYSKKREYFFLEINDVSGINWLKTGLVPHWHKALLVHWIQEAAGFKHLNVTGTERFNVFSCRRALHWVTPQMLCVPVNEEIPEVSDMVVKAITGLWTMTFTFTALNFWCLVHRDYFLPSSEGGPGNVRFAIVFALLD